MRGLLVGMLVVAAACSAHPDKNTVTTGGGLDAIRPLGGQVTPSPSGTCDIPDSLKIDCGHMGTNQQQCEASGCCWKPAGQGSQTPWCYFNHAAKPCKFLFNGNSTTTPFSPSAVATMTKYFMANLNIDGKGGVVASPDTHTPGGSYYYHWMRDGALSMRTLMTIAPHNATTIMTYMSSYAQWVIAQQGHTDPNGIDIRVEPKFYLPNGGPYTGGWCRPQSDGPGLRAITLIKFANWLMAQGNKKYVTDHLYGSSAPKGGAIYYDMIFLLDNWQMNTCDLWEEVQSNDFFWNRFMFRRAFLDAAALATTLGDSTNAAKFKSAAAAVSATLQGHWTGQFVFESTNRKEDAAVIAAFNNGYTDDHVFPPHGVEVAGTIATLNELFCKAFPINQDDTHNGVPGVLYGRYAGDHYAGGNPWVLSSGALAQLFFRAAIATARNSIGLTVNYTAWGAALGMPASSWKTDMDLARSMARAGDAVLARIEYHVRGSGFHLPEQLDKVTGAEASATDLTWSYATVLKAMVSRGEALGLLHQW